MHLVLLGPPGAGKGTQAKLLVAELGIAHISTGDLLRGAIREGTELGRVAQEYVERGDLVPDRLITDMIEQRLKQPDCAPGFLLDGFPRNRAQAETCDRLLQRLGIGLDAVIDLEVPREELLTRLSGRKRADDGEATVRTRLEVYERQTRPLREYYGHQGLLREVRGVGSVEQVFQRILDAVHGVQPSAVGRQA